MILTGEQLDAVMPDVSQLLSDEPEMESSQHYMQLMLLVACLEWLWRDRDDYFIGANLTIYFSRKQLKNRDFRGPDFFLVKQTEKKPRNSWVVWEEDGKYPNLIIELLSDSTAGVDRALKKELYQDRFRTPEYFWFSPTTLEFQGFRLVGHQYHEILPDAQGRRWSEELGLYLGIHDRNLRYFAADGYMMLTSDEFAVQIAQDLERSRRVGEEALRLAERVQLELAEQQQRSQAQLDQEQQRSNRLADQLRSFGINPEL